MPRLADMRRAEMPQATAANHATNRDSTTPRDRCDGSGPVGENAPLSPGQGTWIAFLIPLRWRFWSVGADPLRIGPHGGFVDAWRLAASEAVNVEHRQVVGRRLKEGATVMGLHELFPVGRRAMGGRETGDAAAPCLPALPVTSTVTARRSLGTGHNRRETRANSRLPANLPTPTAARRSARPPKKKQAGVPILDYELGSLVKICHSQTINSCCRVVTECDNDVSQLQPAAFSLDEPALALSTTPSCPRGPSSRQAITARRGSPRHPSPRAKTRAGDRRRARSTCVRRVGP